MAMSVPDPFSSLASGAPELWSGGPSPGSLYQFPGIQSSTRPVQLPATHTLRPMVTGTSVLGVTFADGVMLAADTLGSTLILQATKAGVEPGNTIAPANSSHWSYGSLARFRSVSRMHKVTDSTVVAASGDYADFQYMGRLFEYLAIESDSLDDGHKYTPKSLFSWLTRFMYNRRTRINPLWNTVIVGGYNEEKPFLGYVNSIGTAFEAPTLASGFGAYIAQPLLRDAYAKNNAMSKEEARQLLEKCLRVLFYRDCRAQNKYEVAVITSEGADIQGPFELDTKWDIAHYVRGYD